MGKFTDHNKYRPDNVFTRNAKSFAEWNLKQKFEYFLRKFKQQTGHDFHYDRDKYGLELIMIKRLEMKTSTWRQFIDWACSNELLPHSIYGLKFLRNKFSIYLSKKRGLGFEKESF